MKTDNTWRIATAEDAGKPLIFRIREQTPTFAAKETFQKLLAISWRYISPNEQGMPCMKDAQRMAELEDLLDVGLEDARVAFLTVIVTGNGVREWQWYAREQGKVMEQVNKTLGHLDPFPIQISFQEDPKWQGYSNFLEIATK